MTAFNIIVQPQAAYLVHDTAFYHRKSGKVLGFVPKALLLPNAVDNPAAMAVTGNVLPAALTRWLEDKALRGGADLVAILPALMTEAVRVARGSGVPSADIHLALAVATYDVRRKRAGGYLIGNDTWVLGESYSPGTVRGGMLGWHVSTDHRALFGESARLDDPTVFDARRDASRLLQAQRDEADAPFPIVGGAGVLTTVDARGVHSEVVCEWPDKVGQRIRRCA